MSENTETCKSSCESCKENCSSREKKNPFLAEMNKHSNIKKVIGVVSGKGGVGKSMVTALLASEMNKRGNRVAVLDADITGPSIPKAFGITEKAMMNEEGIIPVSSKEGIKIMSINLLMEHETDPVIWRGPVIAGTVKQFWSDVVWGDVDYMFVDMPPGTGDVPLTVFQSLPLAGIIVVTSPQELVAMIVEKAVNMAGKMNIPVLGLVENMSYVQCPDCGKIINVFGDSNLEWAAEHFNIKDYARMPIMPDLAKACDCGDVEYMEAPMLHNIADILGV